MAFRFAALLVALVGLHSASALRFSRNEVTPVEKVISLLSKLEAQVQEEGAKEAAEYDKYACFCKDQADAKTYAIEKSDEKIKKLDALITELGAEITELDGEVVVLNGEIDTLKTDIKDEKDARKIEHDDWEVADTNVTEAIKAVDEAIRVMKQSKSDQEDAKVDLAQVAQKATGAMSVVKASEAQVKAVTALVSASKQEPAKYEYRSNDIIATLESLSTQFKENKKELYEAEFEAKAASDKKVLAWENEKKFKTAAKLAKEELSAKKGEEKSAAEGEKGEETTAMDADIAFRTELTTQCENRATEWDQRSKARAGELTALAEAKEILKSGVKENYGANKKLTGLAVKAQKVVKVAAPKASKAAPSLLQVSKNSGATEAVKSAVQKLSQLADKIGSPVLSALAAKAELSEDHFVKVRGLINDLISKLEQEALDEASSKAFCDTEMGAAVSNRDTHALKMEEHGATIKEQESLVAELKEDIAVLSQEIAELSKALNEATELRQTEKAENAKTVAEAEAGKAAVEQAITVLEDFYNNAFIQQPDADRSGKTVSDRAPEMSYSGDYKGKQDASSGIIGLLNVILSDFDRTISTVGQEETDAEGEFTTFEGETTTSIGDKKKLVGEKEGDIVTADAAITSAKDALMTAKRLHKDALSELEKLKTMCVEGAESYAERKKKREQEIEALKEALSILENWDS